MESRGFKNSQRGFSSFRKFQFRRWGEKTPH